MHDHFTYQYHIIESDESFRFLYDKIIGFANYSEKKLLFRLTRCEEYEERYRSSVDFTSWQKSTRICQAAFCDILSQLHLLHPVVGTSKIRPHRHRLREPNLPSQKPWKGLQGTKHAEFRASGKFGSLDNEACAE